MERHWIWQMALASVAVILIIRYANANNTGALGSISSLYTPTTAQTGWTVAELGFFVRDAEDLTAFEQYSVASTEDETETGVQLEPAKSDNDTNGILFLAGLFIALLLLT